MPYMADTDIPCSENFPRLLAVLVIFLIVSFEVFESNSVVKWARSNWSLRLTVMRRIIVPTYGNFTAD